MPRIAVLLFFYKISFAHNHGAVWEMYESNPLAILFNLVFDSNYQISHLYLL